MGHDVKPNGDEPNSYGPGAQEPAIDSENMELAGNQWLVEVVPGQVSGAANRIARAFKILLDAAAHAKD